MLSTTACFFDAAVPAPAGEPLPEIACASDEQCPPDWVCRPAIGRCVPIDRAIWMASYIPVDRGHHERAQRSLAIAAERINGGVNLLVFPEGSRSPTGELLPFKSGGVRLAIEAGVDILPVSMVGSRALLPKGSWCARSGALKAVVHEPIATADLGIEQHKALLAEARARIDSVDRTAPAVLTGARSPSTPQRAAS